MVKVEKLVADGFEASMRGMRNPLNSWAKSDSSYTTVSDGENFTNVYTIGPKDLDLCQRLIKAGPEHSKFLRQINISFDVTGPLYWWKEFDTYKINTTSNSCSTMHKIAEKEFTLEDFSCEHLLGWNDDFSAECVINYGHTPDGYPTGTVPIDLMNEIIKMSNVVRELYLKTKDKKYWWQMIQLLPSSYNQKRTITMNYAVARNIIKQRRNHKLDEWKQFLDSLKDLPYAEELLFYGLEG